MMKRSSYSQYFSERRKQKLRRILIPLLLVVSILTAVLMLGNLLKDRLDAAQPLLSLPVFSFPAQSSTARTPSELLLHQRKDTVPLTYAGVDVSAMETSDLHTLTDVYNGISLSVPAEPSESEAAALRQITAEAAAQGLQTCAVLSIGEVICGDVSASLTTAKNLARNFAEIGFTEILFTRITAEESATILVEIPNSVRDAVPGIRVGMGVNSTALESGSFAPALEVLAETADFMALDPESITVTKDAVDLAFHHRGSIDYFTMRILIRGDVNTRAATEAALRTEGYAALQSIP